MIKKLFLISKLVALILIFGTVKFSNANAKSLVQTDSKKAATGPKWVESLTVKKNAKFEESYSLFKIYHPDSKINRYYLTTKAPRRVMTTVEIRPKIYHKFLGMGKELLQNRAPASNCGHMGLTVGWLSLPHRGVKRTVKSQEFCEASIANLNSNQAKTGRAYELLDLFRNYVTARF